MKVAIRKFVDALRCRGFSDRKLAMDEATAELCCGGWQSGSCAPAVRNLGLRGLTSRPLGA